MQLPRPLVHRIGVLADPQVRVPPASLDDVPAWSGATRRYAAVLEHVRTAVKEFRRMEVAYVLQLGDLVDAGNAKAGPSCSSAALVAVEEELVACHEDGLQRVHHVIGNNDIQNFSRQDRAAFDWARRGRRAVGQDIMDQEGAYTHYYDFKPFEDLPWHFIILDSYAVSLMPGASINEEEAKALLKNPDGGSVCCAGLDVGAPCEQFRAELTGDAYNRLAADDPRRRFNTSSGGFGQAQLAWLASVLQRLRESGGDERAIVFGHQPVHPKVVNDPDALAYDYCALLDLLSDYGDCVSAYLAGHDHLGGYARDAKTGVHHLTVPSPLEAEPGTGSRFLVLEFEAEHVLLRGSACVVVEPVQRAFPAPRHQLLDGQVEDKEGHARQLEAQVSNRSLNFATHSGVVWLVAPAQQ